LAPYRWPGSLISNEVTEFLLQSSQRQGGVPDLQALAQGGQEGVLPAERLGARFRGPVHGDGFQHSLLASTADVSVDEGMQLGFVRGEIRGRRVHSNVPLLAAATVVASGASSVRRLKSGCGNRTP
jgi:hypothetical protein